MHINVIKLKKKKVVSIALISLNWATRVPEQNNKGGISVCTVDHYGGAAENIFMTAAV